jgi:hypothetical protein
MVLLKEVHVAGPAQLCIFYRYIYRLASNWNLSGWLVCNTRWRKNTGKIPELAGWCGAERCSTCVEVGTGELFPSPTFMGFRLLTKLKTWGAWKFRTMLLQ